MKITFQDTNLDEGNLCTQASVVLWKFTCDIVSRIKLITYIRVPTRNCKSVYSKSEKKTEASLYRGEGGH